MICSNNFSNSRTFMMGVTPALKGRVFSIFHAYDHTCLIRRLHKYVHTSNIHVHSASQIGRETREQMVEVLQFNVVVSVT